MLSRFIRPTFQSSAGRNILAATPEKVASPHSCKPHGNVARGDREAGVIPARSRHCNRGAADIATVSHEMGRRGARQRSGSQETCPESDARGRKVAPLHSSSR